MAPTGDGGCDWYGRSVRWRCRETQSQALRSDLFGRRRPCRPKTMPPLSREPNLFPAELFQPEYLGLHTDWKWTALYTHSRREKELMRRLYGMGISFYCPVVAQRRRAPSGRVRVSHIPLFSNYVFLYGDEMAR